MPIFIHRRHFNQEKSTIFRQLTSVAGCVRSFMLAQKCTPKFLNFTFLLKQQIKFVFTCKAHTFRKPVFIRCLLGTNETTLFQI